MEEKKKIQRDPFNIGYGAALKLMRKENGYNSQAQFAAAVEDLTGVKLTVDTVAKTENGQQCVSLKQHVAIMSVLDYYFEADQLIQSGMELEDGALLEAYHERVSRFNDRLQGRWLSSELANREIDQRRRLALYALKVRKWLLERDLADFNRAWGASLSEEDLTTIAESTSDKISSLEDE